MNAPKSIFVHKGHLKKACMIAGAVLFALFLVWIRVLYGSMANFQKGTNFLREHQYIKAITFFDRSMHWYTPFNPYVQKSAERLWEIGGYAEQQGDTKLALISYRTIRGAFYAARHFITPGKTWIEKCDAKIAQISMGVKEDQEVAEDLKSPGKTVPNGQTSRAPDIFWSVMVELGLLGWIGSIIGFIMFCLKGKGESTNSTACRMLWPGLAAGFFALWILGLIKA